MIDSLSSIIDSIRIFVSSLDHGIVGYYIFLNFSYLILLFFSLIELVVRQFEVKIEAEELSGTDSYLPITIISPAFNESATIASSAKAMLELNYPSLELIIVNDGSTDATLSVLMNSFSLYPVPSPVRQYLKTNHVKQYYRSISHPNLLVVDKVNGGKSDALNAGINAARTPLFLACDADTILEKSALKSLASTFLTTSNMAACGGTIRVINSCQIEDGNVKKVLFPRDVLPALQAIEYLRAFFLGRLGWNRLGGNLVVSGALGLFDRDLVIEVGGYATYTVGEDMELIVRLHRYFLEKREPKFVRFIVEPLAWTEVPATFSDLGRQRERWHRGLLQSLWIHKKMFLNPKYKTIGLLVYPFFVLGESLAPIIEGIGLLGILVGIFLGSIDIEFIWMFFIAAWGLNILMNLVAILVEQLTYKKYQGLSELGRMVFYAFFENMGYRQLTVIWRLKAFWYWLKGSLSWGELQRKGF